MGRWISVIFQAVGDFDGDGKWEAAAAYRLQDELIVEAYKHNGWIWIKTDEWRGGPHLIHTLYAAPSGDRGHGGHALVIGWQQGQTAYLSVYDWTADGLKEASRYSFPQVSRSEFVSSRAAALFPASVRTLKGTQWGYIDAAGKMILLPVYNYAMPFQDNGLAIVDQNGHSGVIDTEGRFVVEPRYDSINPFSEGLAVASDSKGAKVINESGAVITDREYPYINSFSDGRALFTAGVPSNQQTYGYLDTSGKEIIPARYLEGTDFADSRAVVKVKEQEYMLIGKNGEQLEVYPFAFVGSLSEGLLAYQEKEQGQYGYINEQGDVVIRPAYSGAQPFRDGRAIVNTAEDYGARYGVIDAQGKFVIQGVYNDIRDLGEKRFGLGRAIDPAQPFIGSVYAIADGDGQLLSGFVYSDPEDYKEGYASVHNGRETFFIDRNGDRAMGLPEVPGTGTLAFEGELIRANVDMRLSYLDRSGRIVWEQNREIPLTPPYRVNEAKYKPNKDYLVYYPQVEGMTDQAAQAKVNDTLKELSAVKPVDPAAQLDYSYFGDFSVAFYQKRLLVLGLEGYNYPFGAAHGMPSKLFPHVDLGSGRFYKLKNLFKPDSDYVKVLSGIIGKMIKKDPQYSYVFPDSYKGITADQLFYVTENALHILFAPYEIAPYAAGFPEFVIPFKEIDSLLDKKGAFWRSFH
ncbi:MAG: repeat protein [Paenibacillaceae bacterium]|jgi:hypothetical protein|nr:repeat protein [Paenibacillaceae bacterium]